MKENYLTRWEPRVRSPPGMLRDFRRDLLVPLTDQVCRHVGRGLLYVAVEPDLSALLPVLRVIGIDAGPSAQPAEEGALRRVDHDAHMPRPNHQVPGLRMRHPLELVGPIVKIGRGGVGIGEPGLEIDLSLIHISEPTRQAE